MEIPNDPIMLLSVINMKLRDQYKDLDDLCDDMNIIKTDLIDKLNQVDYVYDLETNQFV